MLAEFTSRSNSPTYVNPDDVSALESKKRYTVIYLKNGNKFSVIESSVEVAKELNNYLQDKIMEALANA